MNKFFSIVLLLLVTHSVCGDEADLTGFGEQYFSAWVATQTPGATEQDVDNYLALLADDVGHQHLPYMTDDARYPSGKQNMREGMKYYLGAHTSYSASLLNVTTGYNVVVIKYSTESAGIHPQTEQTIELNYATIEVLEIEDGKVSVIRKYAE